MVIDDDICRIVELAWAGAKAVRPADCSGAGLRRIRERDVHDSVIFGIRKVDAPG
jgi:hypothetical protein